MQLTSLSCPAAMFNRMTEITKLLFKAARVRVEFTREGWQQLLRLHPSPISAFIQTVNIKADLGLYIASYEERGIHLDNDCQLAGVGKTTMKKAKKIISEADEATKEQLRQGKTTIHYVYSDLVNRDHAGETRICERCHQQKPLAAFSMPSNRASFSSLCLDCEREVEEAARSAAKVASETTDPVETYPVQGMALYKGHPIHIGSVPEDKPEMFSHVLGLLDFAVHGFLADVREAMKWFGPNMRTPENVDQVEALIMDTCAAALKLLRSDEQRTNEED